MSDEPTTPKTRTVNSVVYTLQPVSYAYNSSLAPNAYSDGISGSISQLTSPPSTVLLYEITSMLGASGTDPTEYDVADLSTANEAGGAFNGIDYCYSAIGDGEAADNGRNELQQATGWTSGSQQSWFFNTRYFVGQYGRHNSGANYLACDGHVKWLNGGAVSTGWYFPASVTGRNATTPTTTEDEFFPSPASAGVVGQAAGTQAPGWTMTFSPV